MSAPFDTATICNPHSPHCPKRPVTRSPRFSLPRRSPASIDPDTARLRIVHPDGSSLSVVHSFPWQNRFSKLALWAVKQLAMMDGFCPTQRLYEEEQP